MRVRVGAIQLVFCMATAMGLVLEIDTASACLCSYNGVIGETRPADLSSDVPLNAELLVVTDGLGETVELWQGGVPGATTSVASWERVYALSGNESWRLLRPAKDLLPNTEYAITVGGVVWSSFTTGSVADRMPPAFAGLGSARGVVVPIEGGSTCHNTNPIMRIELDYEDPPTDVAYRVLRLRLEDQAEPFFEVPLADRPGETPYITGRILETTYCSPTAPELVAAETYCATATAYDLAGNPSGGDAERCFTAVKCEPVMAYDLNPRCTPAEPSEGCRAAGDESAGAGLMVLLFLVGMLGRRHQRRR